MRGINSRNTSQQNPCAAPAPFETGCTRLHGQTSGNFAHGGEKRSTAIGRDHSFISYGGGTTLQQTLGLLEIGREVEISEEHLSFAQHRHFLWLRLLHLHDQLGAFKNLPRGSNDV